jgi:hypothetical protein
MSTAVSIISGSSMASANATVTACAGPRCTCASSLAQSTHALDRVRQAEHRQQSAVSRRGHRSLIWYCRMVVAGAICFSLRALSKEASALRAEVLFREADLRTHSA